MDSPERVVRNFRVGKEIGAGATGVIYRAVQTTLDRPVVLKELHPHLAKDLDFIQRFEREAKIAATLQHENIVGVIDFGRDESTYFIALEFVEGSDLKGLIGAGNRLALPVAVSIVLDVLRGLEHAHGRGIVHRDIKPANLMISREGAVKIADFSTSHTSEMPSMTVTGAFMGTPAYMSPEQVSGRPSDARSDLFSTGAVLYEMLCGLRPFDADSYAAIVGRLLTFTPPGVEKLEPTVPRAVAAVVRKSLEKDLDRRYSSAAEFRQALEKAVGGLDLSIGRQVVASFIKNPDGYLAAAARRPSLEPGPTLSRHPEEISTPPRRASTGRRTYWAAAVLAGVSIAGYVAAAGQGLYGLGSTPAPATDTTVATDTTGATGTTAVTDTTGATEPTIETDTTGTAEPIDAPRPGATAKRVAAVTRAAPVPTPRAVRYGGLKVVVDPWAEVFVDGEHVATTPVARPLKVEAGWRVVRFEAPGHRAHEERIRIEPSKETSRNIRLRSLSSGRVTLRSSPWSDVYLEGEHVGTTPLADLELDSGRHVLVLRNPSCDDLTVQVEAHSGKTIAREFTLACNVP